MIGRCTRLAIIAVVSGVVLSCAIKKPQTDLGSLPTVEIQDVRVTEGTEKTVIEVEGEEPIIFTTFHLSDPDRLVVDMAGVSLGRFTEAFQMNQGPIRTVRPVAGGGGNNVSRLEVTLNESVETSVRTEGLNLIVEATQSQNEKNGFVFFDDTTEKQSVVPEKTTPLVSESIAEDPVAQEDESTRLDGPTTASLPLPTVSLESEEMLKAAVQPPSAEETETPGSPITSAEAMEEISNPIDEEADDEPLSREEVKPLPPAKTVRAVHFARDENLQLVIEADGELTPRIFYVDDKRLVIDLPGVEKGMEGHHRVPANDSLVRQVRLWQHPGKLRLVLDLLSPIPYSWAQSQGILTMELISSSTDTALIDGKKETSTEKREDSWGDEIPEKHNSAEEIRSEPPETPLRGEDLLPTTPPAVVPVPKKPITTPIQSFSESEARKLTMGKKADLADRALLKRRRRREKSRLRRAAFARAEAKNEKSLAPLASPQRSKFTGRKISLDFQDADISNVIRLIADVSKLNFVMGEDVKGKITLKIASVPWDQALDIILKTHSLGQVREGNIVRIATLANLSKQRDEVARAKETKIKAEDLSNRVIYVNYGKAKKLSNLLQKLLSPRGGIMVAERVNALIVKDIPGNLDVIEKLAKKLDTKTPQVLIEARIVEIKPTFKRSLGVQWGANVKTIQGGNTIELGNPITSPFTTTSPFSVNLPANDSFGGIGFTFGRLTQTPFTLDLRLSAGETQGMTRIVSTPKIMVLDNHEALIEQGESIPFQTDSGNEGKKIEFIDANLKLNVTPHISPDGGVMLDIHLTKNERGDKFDVGVAILKKEVTTRVLLMDTETMVIGGIYETKKFHTESGVPWLKDIPFLGWLFKKEEKDDSISELLVFITPTIMD